MNIRSFEELLNTVLDHGEPRTDRTGVGTVSLFSPGPLEFDLAGNRVPLVTSKRVAWRMATAELLWMLSGSTSVDDLAAYSPRMADIWRAWANHDGNIGPTYGAQWRDAGGTLLDHDTDFDRLSEYHPAGVDQLRKIVLDLAKSPDTRRAVVSLWSVPELPDMGIEPCMVTFQFSLRGPDYDQLHLHVYQRSADMMLGVPFDLYQAGLLAHLVARELSFTTGKRIRASRLIWTAGDVHVYTNQLAAADEQTRRWRHGEVPGMAATIELTSSPAARLLDGTVRPEHIHVHNYHPLHAIDAGRPAA